MKTVPFVGATNVVHPRRKMHAMDNFKNVHLTLKVFSFESCMCGITPPVTGLMYNTVSCIKTVCSIQNDTKYGVH